MDEYRQEELKRLEETIKEYEKEKYEKQMRGSGNYYTEADLNCTKAKIEDIVFSKFFKADYDVDKRYEELKREAIAEYNKDPFGIVKFPLSEWQIREYRKRIKVLERAIESCYRNLNRNYRGRYAASNRAMDVSIMKKFERERIRALAILEGEEAYVQYLKDVRNEEKKVLQSKVSDSNNTFAIILTVSLSVIIIGIAIPEVGTVLLFIGIVSILIAFLGR